MTVCTVIATLSCEPADQDELLRLARGVLPTFSRQPGFISCALHKSTDGTRVVNYLSWRSEADHQACMQSAEVAEAGADFMAFVQGRNVAIDIAVYGVVETVEAA